jgi:PPOX class probable F420-dependent enzyme
MGRVTGLGRERYISITTFRRDGSPVATPVWVAADGELLYVWTGARTGKAKRIRHNPAVTVAPCTARGTYRYGYWVAGSARTRSGPCGPACDLASAGGQRCLSGIPGHHGALSEWAWCR